MKRVPAAPGEGARDAANRRERRGLGAPGPKERLLRGMLRACTARASSSSYGFASPTAGFTKGPQSRHRMGSAAWNLVNNRAVAPWGSRGAWKQRGTLRSVQLPDH